MYIYIYIYTHTHIYMHRYMYIYICTCCTFIHTQPLTHMHILRFGPRCSKSSSTKQLLQNCQQRPMLRRCWPPSTTMKRYVYVYLCFVLCELSAETHAKTLLATIKDHETVFFLVWVLSRCVHVWLWATWT
jgi:hypothetical protein